MAQKARPAIDRLLPRCIEDERGCWVFVGALSEGYGVVGEAGRKAYCHRVTFTYFVADIPFGLDLDHLCRNRACCNPWHLEPVTRQVNARRGLRGLGYGPRERTHCAQGHEFSPENTYAYAAGDGIRRRCRTCEARWAKNALLRRQAAANPTGGI